MDASQFFDICSFSRLSLAAVHLGFTTLPLVTIKFDHGDQS